YRSWISTKTLPRRVSHLKSIVGNKTNQEWMLFLSEFPNPSNFDLVFKELVEYAVPRTQPAERLLVLKNRVEGKSNVNTNNWTQYYYRGSEEIGKFLNSLFQELIKVPDIHLA